MRLTTQQITTGAVLLALTVVLSLTRLGEIPVPTPARAVTWSHIPVILAGIMLGPVMGGIVGLAWGFGQFFSYNAIIPDVIVHVPPRILVGIISALVYEGVRRLAAAFRPGSEISLGAAGAAVAGTLTNSVGVLGLMYLRGYLPLPAALAAGAIHAPIEILVSVLLVVPITVAVKSRGR